MYIIPTLDNLKDLLPQVRAIAVGAGEKIRAVYQKDFAVSYKSDESPVTEADLLAHEYITAGLEKLQPSFPVLSEESSEIPFSERKTWETYWLVDPLDGTREFINRRDDFTVNIALIHQQKSVLGVVHLPVTQESYVAVCGGGADKFSADGTSRKLHVRRQKADELIVTISYSHAGGETKKFLQQIGPYRVLRHGSMVKCCIIAEGKADIYPRLGNTCEWDTAAGQCVLEEAGGYLTDWQGNPFRYNTKDSTLNPPFVAYAPSVPDTVLGFTTGESIGNYIQ